MAPEIVGANRDKFPPTHTGELEDILGETGVGFTTTIPLILLDVQPLAFFTVKVYEILEPDAPLLRLTVIGEDGKAASVTVVIPTPEIEYVVGVPVVAVYGIANELAPEQITGLVLVVIVGKGFMSTLPFTLLEVHPPPFLTVKIYDMFEPDAGLLKLTVIGLEVNAPFVTPVIPVPEIE